MQERGENLTSFTPKRLFLLNIFNRSWEKIFFLWVYRERAHILHMAHKYFIYMILKGTAGILAISHFIEKFLKFVTSCLGSFCSTLIFCSSWFHFTSLINLSFLLCFSPCAPLCLLQVITQPLKPAFQPFSLLLLGFLTASVWIVGDCFGSMRTKLWD